jgi:serine/threonine-protein kinase RsbW
MRDMQQAFPGRVGSVAEVRALVREFCEKQGLAGEAVEDAVLVISELAANAVQHTRSGGPHGWYRVLLRAGVTRLRMQVTDAGSATRPMARRARGPEDFAASGRGLQLVEALAVRWYVGGDHRSWTVTADIALTPTPFSPAP